MQYKGNKIIRRDGLFSSVKTSGRFFGDEEIFR